MITTMTMIAPVRANLVLDTVKPVINRAMMGLPVRPLGKGIPWSLRMGRLFLARFPWTLMRMQRLQLGYNKGSIGGMKRIAGLFDDH